MDPDQAVLIVDEDYEKLHRTTLELEAKGFHLIISDNAHQLIEYFSGREYPYLAFISETILHKDRLVKILKNSHRKHIIVPIYPLGSSTSDTLSIIRPYSAANFLTIIRNVLNIGA